ncbi:hypothetical protein FOMPIDRAFT_1055537 [Fomitopsis schrenkii]|uniref:PARP catalytic domain-containing protein n=1 Tax=Fomitopsis schrenkii TaxID=2126942 RepID=S8F4P8_FOMSC|nr:hypothetical protein FOMPIDRAFT_1055537 [Fomitopsis schrenkii]
MNNGKLSDFCSKKCRDDAFKSAPLLLMVPNNHASFKEVSKQFKDQWKHPTPVPTVVWKIHCDHVHIDDFQRYKDTVERKSNVPHGNSRRRWHGTVRVCTVGDSQGQAALCNNALCSLCTIIRTSYRVAKAGQRFGFKRFGSGIYTTATSSKANDYVVQRGRSGFKAILLNDVVLGRGAKTTKGDGTLTKASLLSKQFRDQWKLPSPAPTIVWKIYCDQGHIDKFQRYKLAVERKSNVQGGNSRRRWHGTVRACTVGESPGKSALCNNTLCSLCNIIRTSFRIPNHGGNLQWGKGIYTSATSSKANLFAREQGGSGFKAMLLNDVVLGRVFKMSADNTTLTQPPMGYDAVVGEPVGGFDEAIVYTSEAIRPLFLIIYKP